MQKEGQALGHCVSGYIPHIANRKCDVYFIRKKTDPDTPFLLLTGEEGRLCNVRGKGGSIIHRKW
ncbi:MAG: PcfJ domain-containing protein [Coprococcus phoceensis]